MKAILEQEMQCGVSGWLDWELVNTDGSIESSGSQHNLLLNSGLNNIGIQSPFRAFFGICVGTGSSTPVITQTALDVQVARTDSIYRATESLAETPGTYSRTIFYEFSAAAIANQNLTEWGVNNFSDLVNGINNNISVRELFRDGGGNPIVITPNGSQKLRLAYKVRYIIPVGPINGTLVIDGVGSFPMKYGISSPQLFTTFETLNNVFEGNGNYLCAITRPVTLDAQKDIRANNDANNVYYRQNSGQYVTRYASTRSAYVTGSYALAGFQYIMDTNEMNVNVYGFTMLNSDSAYFAGGFYIIFDNDAFFTKADTHRLNVKLPALSWSRAQ